MSAEKKGIKKVQKISVEESSSDIEQYQDNFSFQENNINNNSVSNNTITSNSQPSTTEYKKNTNDERQNYNKKIEEERKRISSELEHDDDIFDEEGNLIQKENISSEKIQELKRKLKEQLNLLFELIKQKLEEPLIRIKTILIKITSKITKPILNIISKTFDFIFTKFFKVKKVEQNEIVEEIQEEKEIPLEEKYLLANFNDMRELNVIFTDNYDIPFYKKKKEGSPNFSKVEEEIMMANAIDSIKQCAEFTIDMPPIQEGIFKGNKISDMMENVTEIEVKLFLGYVKARPQKYTSKSWKISETFATWLVNNSPVAEKK